MENEATTKTPIPTTSGFRNFALCTLIFALPNSLSVCLFVPLCLSGQDSIMQNKPNFKMGNMTISTARTRAYANEQRTMSNERYPKQTQSNPISNGAPTLLGGPAPKRECFYWELHEQQSLQAVRQLAMESYLASSVLREREIFGGSLHKKVLISESLSPILSGNAFWGG
jgi:hypothetical protein